MRLKKYLVGILCLFLSACTVLPRSPKPVLKIGLVAPFEGRDRALGYEALGAVKEAIGARNVAGGVAGYMIELVALNDNNVPDESAFQARKFAVDADVMGVIGPFSEAALEAAAPVYDELDLPLIAPVAADGRLHPAVFSLAASPEELAIVLLEHLPHENNPALICANGDLLCDALRPTIRRVIDEPDDIPDLVRKLHLARWQPASHILFDGDVLTAAELLLELRAVGGEQRLLGGPSLARVQLPQIAGAAAQNACYAIAAPTSSDRSPWAGLAFEATTLLLDTLEKAIQTGGKPARQSVLTQLDADFEAHRQANIAIRLYCYGPDPVYPGQPIR